jgi:hypothetical protein
MCIEKAFVCKGHLCYVAIRILREGVMNSKGRSTYEILLVTIVVALSVAIAVGIYARRTTVDDGRAMIDELFVLRRGIVLYHTLRGVHPSSLEVLASETYLDGERKEVLFVERLHRDDSGRIIDPFGNPYSYEPRAGWLKSSTEGYEQW